MDLVRLFTSPDGRINRSMFWLGWLTVLAAELAARLALDIPVAPSPADPLSVRFLSFVVDVTLLYPEAVIMVKRLHDRNRSGQLIGWLFVPYSVLILTNLLGMSGDPEHVGFVEGILLAATGIIALAFMIDLGFRRGTAGDNQFGPDPRPVKRVK
jgi:uncharacterized membrane protein YhaH (DUF805 family)